MDWNHIGLLLGVIHASQEVDPWFGQEARKELMKIKAAATKPTAPTIAAVTEAELPKARPIPVYPETSSVRRA